MKKNILLRFIVAEQTMSQIVVVLCKFTITQFKYFNQFNQSMPLLPNPAFKPPFYLPNGHFQTIYPSVFRKVKNFNYQRERLELLDGDFLDLDWSKNNSNKLIVLTHGLEGSTHRSYVKGMAKVFVENNWDVLAWNCRSCSGEMNRTLKFYHHGGIEDISIVVNYALECKKYESIVLVGFSMGGAITMNYLGRHGDVPSQVKTGIGFSMPTDLDSSARLLTEIPINKVYHTRFLEKLAEKIRYKAAQFPDKLDASHLKNIYAWRDFDECYSAPLFGYKNADEFYYYSSSINILDKIKIPFLISNAQNDPLLSPLCSPKNLAKQLPNFYLETPEFGGHVGFFPYKKDYSWMDERALQWVDFVNRL